jgi:cytolysin (calcineurin-like family phosphatase)
MRFRGLFAGSLCTLAVASAQAATLDPASLAGDWEGTADTSYGHDRFSLNVNGVGVVHVVRTTPSGDVGQPYDAQIKPWGNTDQDYFMNPSGTAIYLFSRQGDTLVGYWAFGPHGIHRPIHLTLQSK